MSESHPRIGIAMSDAVKDQTFEIKLLTGPYAMAVAANTIRKNEVVCHVGGNLVEGVGAVQDLGWHGMRV